ncbi:CDP-diacylglycerol--glycerol-3-phosphate 3-phosphatidyltransferase [Mycena venus]|uniref:CDP-diacylglycerol--glycerol-3-phosphate 3-phosphatidyltransferase n=1 Tax=Mycena venus TaxID=2733690 RepID=A0A8H6XA49_9AGAR|nr:CDP-diacylglycerol--glycerol-3-phosphate 3-phosphatidyltransferase [Mycena venus]
MLSRSLRLLERVSVTKIHVQAPALRCISSASNPHPLIQGFAGKLQQPKFAVSPDEIRILSKPTQFYSQLIDMIRRAQTRIFISSLYLGSGESELVSALEEALNKKPELQIYMLFDLNRSTRPGPHSTAKLLAPLVSQFPERVHVSFFRSPSLRGILAKLVPPRFNEGWGTWHAKIYGVDDEVMISGANLNNSYFTNRQDRYIHFTGQEHLSRYCLDFIKTVSGFSFKLQLPSAGGPIGPYSCRDREYALLWPIPETHPHHIHNTAESALSSLQNNYRRTTPEQRFDSQKVTMFPLIQAGQFNIREEETTLAMLFEHLNAESKSNGKGTRPPVLDLTSGYFGLYKEYQNLILRSSNIDCRIVAASPRANGFYGSRGVSGRIPEGYTLLEQRFMSAVQRAGRQSGVQLYEWEREGWTYHAKGIWLSESPAHPPLLTLFGSTNLNSRSAHIDTELSFLMLVPESSSVSDSLRDELNNLRAHSRPWMGAWRRVRCGTKVLVGLVGGML